MIGYKLLRKRKDGSIGSLFINTKQRFDKDVWYNAESHPTKGFKFRPYFHVMTHTNAPHLSTKGRVWCEVECEDFEFMERPERQGGTWILANKMKIIKELTNV